MLKIKIAVILVSILSFSNCQRFLQDGTSTLPISSSDKKEEINDQYDDAEKTLSDAYDNKKFQRDEFRNQSRHFEKEIERHSKEVGRGIRQFEKLGESIASKYQNMVNRLSKSEKGKDLFNALDNAEDQLKKSFKDPEAKEYREAAVHNLEAAGFEFLNLGVDTAKRAFDNTREYASKLVYDIQMAGEEVNKEAKGAFEAVNEQLEKLFG